MRSISASVGDQNDTSHGPLGEAARAAAVQPTRLEHPRFLDAVGAQTSFGQAHIEDMSDNYLSQAFQRCAPRQPRVRFWPDSAVAEDSRAKAVAFFSTAFAKP